MGRGRRWDPCVAHRDDEAEAFVADYFLQPGRRAFVVTGAGFDPRSRAVVARLSEMAGTMRALLVRENRPSPPEWQLERADANTTALRTLLTERQVDHEVKEVDIFAPDGAVVGGRNIIDLLHRQNLEGVTDVIVDISALSTGTSFPTIRYFVEYCHAGHTTVNLHVFVVHDPALDAAIGSIPTDRPSYVHGFKGRSTLSDTADAARLWLPQLAIGRRAALGRLYDFIGPHDTCPILPFPASDPRIGDVLAEEYLTELENTWSVDSRNIIYSDEGGSTGSVPHYSRTGRPS